MKISSTEEQMAGELVLWPKLLIKMKLVHLSIRVFASGVLLTNFVRKNSTLAFKHGKPF